VQPAVDLYDCKKGEYTKLQMKLKVIEMCDQNEYFYVAVLPSDKKQLFTVDASKAQEILDCKFLIANII